jgi:hypothetical protein
LLWAGAGACVIAFSTTDRASFDAVASWKRKVEAEVGSIPMALVQNKVRLPPARMLGLRAVCSNGRDSSDVR